MVAKALNQPQPDDPSESAPELALGRLAIYDFSNERLEKAQASAELALTLIPGLPEGHRALGFYHYYGFREYDKALEEFAIASRGLPNDTRLHSGIAYVHRRRGHFEKAIDTIMDWGRIDPRLWMSGPRS